MNDTSTHQPLEKIPMVPTFSYTGDGPALFAVVDGQFFDLTNGYDGLPEGMSDRDRTLVLALCLLAVDRIEKRNEEESRPMQPRRIPK